MASVVFGCGEEGVNTLPGTLASGVKRGALRVVMASEVVSKNTSGGGIGGRNGEAKTDLAF